MSEVTLPSGAKLQITVSPFQDALALEKALLRSAKGSPLSTNILDMDISALKDTLIAAATSDDVERCLFKCFERTTYNGIRVTPDLFDDPKMGEGMRRDYYAIAWNVIEANCKPFFEQTFSWLKARRQTATESPK